MLGPTIITDIDTAFCKNCGYPLSQKRQMLQENEEGTCPSCKYPWVENLTAPVFKQTIPVQGQYSSDEMKQYLLDIKNSLNKIEDYLREIVRFKTIEERRKIWKIDE